MNILTIITAFSFVGAFHITAKVGQPKSTKTIRMIRSDDITTHCLRLLKSLITAETFHKENRSEIKSKTIMLAKKCSKIQAVGATIQKLTSKHRNRYSLWW